jgi:hypothetical protein
MKTLPDGRRIRISMITVMNGELISSQAADAWQESDGTISLSGLWDGLVPLAEEDHVLMAHQAGVSPLEWFYRRLLTCPVVSMEIFD